MRKINPLRHATKHWETYGFEPPCNTDGIHARNYGAGDSQPCVDACLSCTAYHCRGDCQKIHAIRRENRSYTGAELYYFQGERRTIPQIAKIIGIKVNTLEDRVHREGVKAIRDLQLENGIEYDGVRYCTLQNLCLELNLPYQSVWLRYKKWRWPLNDAVKYYKLSRQQRKEVKEDVERKIIEGSC